jgi:uroporphyrinogen-III synthase
MGIKLLSNIYILSTKKSDKAITLGLLTQEFIDIDIDISEYKNVIFTSTNTVKALKKYYEQLKTKKIFSIGKATTQLLESFDIDVEFGDSDLSGDEFANRLIPYLKSSKTLFPHAKKMVSNSLKLFQDANLDLDDIVVYQTICNKTDKKLSKNSTIIFSSPSTIECFLKNYKWDANFKAVVIGKTTASFMPKYINYIISPHHTISSCVDTALELYFSK